VRLFNPTPSSFPNGMRLLIMLDTTNRVYNGTGTNSAGNVYIDVMQPLASGAHVDVLVQYYVPDVRIVPNPTLVAEPLPFAIPPTPAPQLNASRLANGNLVVRFTAATNRLYHIQSSSNCTGWDTLPGLIFGAGETVQWTNSPAAQHQFFRALMLPH
ncbi:MAG TPA: hypothetical protein VK530_20695, partial [Candidatus Acidoferrum sp.]|nr:hypothetical protein [Candidatus Acidoferrum sp.]